MIKTIYSLEPELDDGVGNQYIAEDLGVDEDEYDEWINKTLYPKPGKGTLRAADLPDLSQRFKPPPLRVVNPKLPATDLIYWPPLLFAFSTRAIELLSDMIPVTAQVIPLACKGRDDIRYVNLTELHDVLDLKRSKADWISKGFASSVSRYVFHFPRRFDRHLFILPNTYLRFYVTDHFKRRVEESGLKGFQFEEVWSSSDA
jgi:hypothetical protein